MLQKTVISIFLTAATLSAAAAPTVVRFNAVETEITLENMGSTPDRLILSSYLSDNGGGSMNGDLYTTATLSGYNSWEAPFEVNSVAIAAGSTLNDSTGWASPFDWNSGESITAWLAWVQRPNPCANRSTIVFFEGDPSTSEQNSLATGVYYTGFRWIGDDEATRYGWIAFDFERMPYGGTRYEDKWGGCENMFYDELKEPIFRFIAVGWETEPDTPITVGGGICPSDFNFDAQINFFDISAYLAAFSAQDPAADLTGDGEFDFFDISALLNQFSTPCEF